jgi:hypothetical protein
MTRINERTRQDCNWIVPQAAAMRAELMQRRLQGVAGLEERIAVMIEVRAMDYNEMRDAIAATE